MKYVVAPLVTACFLSRLAASLFLPRGAPQVRLPFLERRDVLWGGAAAAACGGLLLGSPPSALGAVCDQAVSHLVDRASGRELYLVGTAHISSISAVLVQDTIRAVRPSMVFVELDIDRAQKMGGDGPSGGQKVIVPTWQFEASPDGSSRGSGGGGGGGTPGSFVGKLLSPAPLGEAIKGFYRNMDKAGFKSGQEFAVAIAEARALGCPVLLADQPVSRTLQRVSEALTRVGLDRVTSKGLSQQPLLRSPIRP